MSEGQELTLAAAVLALVVAIAAAMTAMLLQRRTPQKPIGDLVLRTTLWLAGEFFVVPVAFGFWLLSREDCPPDDVCDAGAMAFAGLILLATMAVVISLIIGPLVANWTIRKLRNR